MKLKVFSYIPTLIILEDNVAYVIEAGGIKVILWHKACSLNE
jgi:hypothetical protein